MSNVEDIKVEKGDVVDANYDETTGFLKWKITMNPKQTKTLTFSYTVEYNKNKQLTNTF